MAQAKFVIFDGTLTNQDVDGNAITANGDYDLFISNSVNNSVSLPSLRIVVDYELMTPVEFIGGINVIVESENDGVWYPIAYQFEPYFNQAQGTKRIIVLQPDMSTFDDGIDSIIYFAGKTEGRISRQQGKVGDSFRVRVSLVENGYGQHNDQYTFGSLKVHITGELYD